MDPGSWRCDDTVPSATLLGTVTASAVQKDGERSSTPAECSGPRCRRLQPTVVLRHWNGDVSGGASPPSSRSTKNRSSNDDDVSDDATVRPAADMESPYQARGVEVSK